MNVMAGHVAVTDIPTYIYTAALIPIILMPDHVYLLSLRYYEAS